MFPRVVSFISRSRAPSPRCGNFLDWRFASGEAPHLKPATPERLLVTAMNCSHQARPARCLRICRLLGPTATTSPKRFLPRSWNGGSIATCAFSGSAGWKNSGTRQKGYPLLLVGGASNRS